MVIGEEYDLSATIEFIVYTDSHCAETCEMGVGWTNDNFDPSGFRLEVTHIPTVYQMTLSAIGGLLERKKLFSHVEDDDIILDKEVVEPYNDKEKIKEILTPHPGVVDDE